MSCVMADMLVGKQRAEAMLSNKAELPVENPESKKTRKIIKQTACIALLAIGLIVAAVLVAKTGINVAPQISLVCAAGGLTALASLPMPWAIARSREIERKEEAVIATNRTAAIDELLKDYL